jgi:hypothetical protein
MSAEDDILRKASAVAAARDEILPVLTRLVNDTSDPGILVRLCLACAIHFQDALYGAETVPGMLRVAAEAVETATARRH